MAEYTAVPTSTRSALVAGAVDVNLQNQGSCLLRYATHTTTPTGVGMTLKPGQVHPVKVAAGSSLYVWAQDASADARVVAIDVPST